MLNEHQQDVDRYQQEDRGYNRESNKMRGGQKGNYNDRRDDRREPRGGRDERPPRQERTYDNNSYGGNN
jgi:ribosomal protein L4